MLEGAVKERLKCKTRTVELSLPQRCSSHIASLTDVTESREIGYGAVELAIEGKSGKMAAFKRKLGTYGVDIVDVDAYLVANKTKYVPDEFINAERNFMTQECIDYMLPLIQGEKIIELDGGLPRHFKLR